MMQTTVAFCHKKITLRNCKILSNFITLLGSRTRASITVGYGMPSVSTAYKIFKDKSNQELQETLVSYGQRAAVNAARAYLINFVPVVGDVYRAYQFANIMYDYYNKVKVEYEKNERLQDSLLVAGGQELRELAESATKSLLVESVVDSQWEKFRPVGSNSQDKIRNPAFESVVKSAMYDTLEEII